MGKSIQSWIETSRRKLADGTMQQSDLDALEGLSEERMQKVLYLYSKSTNMRSQIAGWALYDPAEPHEPTLPSADAPYETVIDAVADGWRVVQFPIPDLYKFSNVENQYLGYEFVLERFA